MFWWRVELDKSGAILTCDYVADKGRNGGRVIFVEADTKANACTAAKAWHRRFIEYQRGRSAKYEARNIAAGLCAKCRAPKPPERLAKRQCADCTARQIARAKAVKAGLVEKKHKPTDEELVERHARYIERAPVRRAASEACAKRRAKRTVSLVALLELLDKVGPTAFRAWLVTEIEQRQRPVAPFSEDSLAEAAE